MTTSQLGRVHLDTDPPAKTRPEPREVAHQGEKAKWAVAEERRKNPKKKWAMKFAKSGMKINAHTTRVGASTSAPSVMVTTRQSTAKLNMLDR